MALFLFQNPIQNNAFTFACHASQHTTAWLWQFLRPVLMTLTSKLVRYSFRILNQSGLFRENNQQDIYVYNKRCIFRIDFHNYGNWQVQNLQGRWHAREPGKEPTLQPKSEPVLQMKFKGSLLENYLLLHLTGEWDEAHSHYGKSSVSLQVH